MSYIEIKMYSFFQTVFFFRCLRLSVWLFHILNKCLILCLLVRQRDVFFRFLPDIPHFKLCAVLTTDERSTWLATWRRVIKVTNAYLFHYLYSLTHKKSHDPEDNNGWPLTPVLFIALIMCLVKSNFCFC